MPSYDLEGYELNSAYDIDGLTLEEAYDIDGNPLGHSFRVMTYNVQRFQGINAQQTMQDVIIGKYQPNIIGMQELGSGSLGTVGVNMLEDYGTKQLSSHNNKVMMVAKDSLNNYSTADFTNQDPKDAQLYGETRAYQKATITVNGKSIVWINTHLCFNTQSVKWQQMGEIFTMAEQEEYCIITGDFNAYCTSVSDSDYTNMYKPFVDAGYNLANCTAEQGFMKTWTDSTTATSTAQMTYPTDNIITTGNIDILSVVYDPTKFSYLNGSAVDHIPVIAYLKIN